MVKRTGEGGQVLLLALVVLLVASLAAGLVAGALALEQRMLLREVESARLRALLDAAVSTGVAKVVEDSRYGGHSEELAGGHLALAAERASRTTVTLDVLVEFRSRRAGGRATIALLGEDGPKVVRWEPLPPERLPASLRRR